jgi:hypothetical protein
MSMLQQQRPSDTPRTNHLIVRLAQKAPCSVLFSEDFQHSQTVSDLRIVNPLVTVGICRGLPLLDAMTS